MRPEGPEAVPVEEMLSAHIFGEYMPFDLSRDGKWVAYTLQDNRRVKPPSGRTYFTQTGASPFGNGCDIWIANLELATSRSLTGGQGNNWSPAWSPDGKHLAFYSDRDGRAKLWVWDAATDKLRKVSDAVIRSLLNPIQWTPDGKQVLTKVLPQGMTMNEADDLIAVNGRIAGADISPGVAVYRSPAVESGPIATSSDAWNLNYTFADLAFADIESGKVLRIVLGERIAQYWLSPDGTQVAYSKNVRFESPDSQQILYDIVVYSLRTNHHQVLAPMVQLDYDGSSVSWSPDSTMLAFRTAGMSAKGDCFVVGSAGGSPRNLTSASLPSFSGSRFQPPLWDVLGQYVYFVGANSLWRASIPSGVATKVGAIPGRTIELISAEQGRQLWTTDRGRSTIVATFDGETKQAGFYKVDLVTGQSLKLREESKSFSSPMRYATAVSKDRLRVVYLAQDTQHGLDLWLSDADFRSSRQVTHSNPQLDSYVMGEGRVISWNSLDGQLLQGALLLPSGYQDGQRYPLVVKVYGGSSLSNSVNRFGMQRGLAENLQLFATRGYAVLLPDSPLHLGTPMIDLMKTVLPGVNKVVEMGIADPDRLGIMGHSYGGYSTLCLLVQTPRFKAAMMSGGLGNLISSYGQMTSAGTSYGVAVSEKGQARMGGTPWEYRERYLENSPSFYLDRIQTPLLIVHGAADAEVGGGVSPFLAEEIFVGLRRLKKTVEFAKYQGEDHWPGDWGYPNQVDYAVRVLAWFDKYLKPKPPEMNSSSPNTQIDSK
jgi:dipeptidyl aminopeptidase/acylaminoacyl peptidase